MRRGVPVVVVLLAGVAAGHDVSADVGVMVTSTSDSNPRTGNVSVGAGGSVDVSEPVSLFGTFLYTRDFPTTSGTERTSGSDIFLLSLGAGWFPSRHLGTTLAVLGSPPAHQRNATAVQLGPERFTSLVVSARTWSVGGLWTGSWTSAGLSTVEHTVDLIGGVVRFDLAQRLVLNPTVARIVQQSCAGAGAGFAACGLVRGDATPLVQGRVGAGYTVTLGYRTDLGVEAMVYLYDRDPELVGLFSLVSLGRVELGAGLPVLPLLFSVKPNISHRVGQFTLRFVYQLGVYTGGNGTTHSLSAKVTWRVNDTWRPYLQVVGQVDGMDGAVVNPGGHAVAGVLVVL